MRHPAPPVAAVIGFIDRINRSDTEGLVALMSDDHVLAILDEPPVSGRETLRAAWRGYFEAFPEYVIYPRRITQDGGRVAVLGHTTGSHLGLPDEEESHIDVIWTAEVRDGLLTRWAIVEDTPDARREPGMS